MEKRKQYCIDNKEHIFNQTKEYAIKNKERLSEYHQNYRKNHKEQTAERARIKTIVSVVVVLIWMEEPDIINLIYISYSKIKYNCII